MYEIIEYHSLFFCRDMLTPLSNNQIYNNAEFIHPRGSYRKKPPTIMEYILNSVFNIFKKQDPYTDRRKSLFQKRRMKFDNYGLKQNMYRPRRPFKSESINSVLVDCRYVIPRKMKCSKIFPYGHLKCCSLVNRKQRRRY